MISSDFGALEDQNKRDRWSATNVHISGEALLSSQRENGRLLEDDKNANFTVSLANFAPFNWRTMVQYTVLRNSFHVMREVGNMRDYASRLITSVFLHRLSFLLEQRHIK